MLLHEFLLNLKFVLIFKKIDLMSLHNRIDKKILKDLLKSEQKSRITFSFYKYTSIKDPYLFRDELYRKWEALEVYGRAYVATEGINAQLSVPGELLETFKKDLYKTDFLNKVRLNIAVEDNGKSFYKLKIKVRSKIVADGLEDDSFDAAKSGIHLNAAAFNELTDKEETIVVDMRNHYESEVGYFDKAIRPDVDTFRESLPKVKELLSKNKDNPIVMYCTGGIRCEKASAYLKHNGFNNVYQLEGGIIQYAQTVQKDQLPNKFKGKNFVFDERLGEKISEEVISHCHQCDAPCDTHTNCINEACHLLFIQCPECAKKYDSCCSMDCSDFIKLPLEQQKELRKGKKKQQNIFKKGRSEKLKFKQ